MCTRVMVCSTMLIGTGVGDFSDPENLALAASFPQGTKSDQFYLYDDLAGANVDYSSGINKLALSVSGGQLYFLTNSFMAYTGNYTSSPTLAGGAGLTFPQLASHPVDNQFPNFDFIRFCYGNNTQLTINKKFIYNEATITGPP